MLRLDPARYGAPSSAHGRRPHHDEMLAKMFADVAFNALFAIGDNREMRFDFFREFVALACRFRDPD